MKDGEKSFNKKKCSDRFHATDKYSLNILEVHQSSVNPLLLLSFLHTRALSAFILPFFQMHEYAGGELRTRAADSLDEGELVLPGVSVQFFTWELW